MTIPLLDTMETQARLLIEAALLPTQGSRFAPTGFPNLGPAEYEAPGANGERIPMLLVESPQSIANRLESLAWDDATNDLVAPLRGIPYVKADVDGISTDSIRESHRLNSPYLIQGLKEQLAAKAAIDLKKTKISDATNDDAASEGSTSVDIRKLAAAVFSYDPNTVLHGVFLEKIVGLARLTRLLSGFVEASEVEMVASGGVKNDRIDPSGKSFEGGAKTGYGNVPFARTEFTAKSIIAYFSFDDMLLRSYGLPESANRLLRALALWKITSFLSEPRRLRTNCDLDVAEINVKRPSGTTLPTLSELTLFLRSAIDGCAAEGLFASPAVTIVPFVGVKKGKAKS
jgi:CRISPR-associated protein Csb1